MDRVTAVNPFQCRMWAWHDRLEQMISEETCREVIDSIGRHGQLVPVLARPLINDPDHCIELIYGARRLFAAQHLNLPLQVELRNVTDREAIIAMDIENRQRMDISPYERGLSYARWLRAGHFQNQDELASSLRISSSQVSRMLKLARLPAAVVGAFSKPTDICETWGSQLVDCLDDPRQRPLVLEKSRSIASVDRRPPAREVFRQLIAATAPGHKIRARPRDDVVKSADGTPLFRIRLQTNTIAVILPAGSVSTSTLRDITAAITKILDPAEPSIASAMRPDDAASVPRQPIARDSHHWRPPSIELPLRPAGLVSAHGGFSTTSANSLGSEMTPLIGTKRLALPR